MNRADRLLLHLSTVLLAVSGISFAVMKYGMEPVDPYAVIHHPLQPWALYLHIWAGPLSLFAMGWIARDHIWGESRRARPRFRRSGIASLSSWGLSTVTGYLLQTVTAETLRWVLVVAHLAAGGVFLLVYLGHLVLALWAIRARRRGGRLVSQMAPGYNASGSNQETESPPSVEGLA